MVKVKHENEGDLNEKPCDNKASFTRMTLISLRFYLQPPWLYWVKDNTNADADANADAEISIWLLISELCELYNIDTLYMI